MTIPCKSIFHIHHRETGLSSRKNFIIELKDSRLSLMIFGASLASNFYRLNAQEMKEAAVHLKTRDIKDLTEDDRNVASKAVGKVFQMTLGISMLMLTASSTQFFERQTALYPSLTSWFRLASVFGFTTSSLLIDSWDSYYLTFSTSRGS